MDVDNSRAYVYNKRKTLSLAADYINQLLLPGIGLVVPSQALPQLPLLSILYISENPLSSRY